MKHNQTLSGTIFKVYLKAVYTAYSSHIESTERCHYNALRVFASVYSLLQNRPETLIRWVLCTVQSLQKCVMEIDRQSHPFLSYTN